MAYNKENFYEAPFGSGKTFSENIMLLLRHLRRDNGEIDPNVAKFIALEEAWYNGCPRPKMHIDDKGAWEMAVDYARNNFLYGSMVREAEKKDEKTLFKELTDGEESFEGKFEPKRVPTTLSKEGKVSGFAQEIPYAITSSFWKIVDDSKENTPDSEWETFVNLHEELIKAVRNSNTLTELQENWGTAIGNK